MVSRFLVQTRVGRRNLVLDKGLDLSQEGTFCGTTCAGLVYSTMQSGSAAAMRPFAIRL